MYSLPVVLLSAFAAQAEPGAASAFTAGEARSPLCERVSTPSDAADLRSESIVCTERLLRLGVRRAQDEAMLTSLDQRAARIARAVSQSQGVANARTWRVEVFYPDPNVAYKVDFAVKEALVRHGLRVSDQSVSLSATDVRALAALEPARAYPAACAHYAQTGTLPMSQPLLAVVALTDHDTDLHAGVCDAGQWTWL